MTEQRKLISKALEELETEVFTAKELYKILENKNISKSAIYRNLSYLEKNNLICKVLNEKSNEVLYRYINNKKCNNIIHLICDSCNNTIHLDDKVTNLISNNAVKKFGFKVNKQTTSIKGTCKNCIKSEN